MDDHIAPDLINLLRFSAKILQVQDCISDCLIILGVKQYYSPLKNRFKQEGC